MLSNRVGIFFIWVGLGLVVLFILSDIAKTPTCNFLIFGAIFLAVGLALWFRGPFQQPKETGRFRILRSAKKAEKKK